MIFGTKNDFAIRIEVNNYFHDDSVGEGKFIIYLKNVAYGINKSYATTFSCIKDELLKFSNNLINSNEPLDSYNCFEIANGYYLQNYSDSNTSMYGNELLTKTKHLISWSPDSAFDDGSYLIHIDDNDFTRIIGFKSCMKSGHAMLKKNSINEITIERCSFEKILNDAYSYLVNLSK